MIKAYSVGLTTASDRRHACRGRGNVTALVADAGVAGASKRRAGGGMKGRRRRRRRYTVVIRRVVAARTGRVTAV